MKKRKSRLLQRILASLFVASLITGSASNAASMTVLAKEPGEAQESAEGNAAEIIEGESVTMLGKEIEEPGMKPAEGETVTKPGEGPETKPAEGGTVQKPEGVTLSGTAVGEETPVTVSGNGLETKPLAQPQRVMMLAEPALLADRGWEFDSYSGKLTISTDDGMTDGISNGRNDFSIYNNMKSVEIKSGVTSIESKAFDGCVKLTSVTIPAGVTSIGAGAFDGCQGLTSVTIPAGVTSIGDKAFNGCHGLTSVTIPAGVTSIGNEVFAWCVGLTSVTIPAGVKSIGERAFAECCTLTSVTIPVGVTVIGERAFAGCYGLTSVAIPASVTSIGEEAFYACSGLAAVTMQGDPPTLGGTVFGEFINASNDKRCAFVKNGTQGIRVPESKLQAYQTAWADWAAYIAGDSSLDGGSGGGSDDDSDDDGGSHSGNGAGGDNGGSDTADEAQGGGDQVGGGSDGNNGGAGNAPAAAAPAPAEQPRVKQEQEGNIQKEVSVTGENTLDASVDTPLSKLAELVLTEAERQQAAAGTNVRIVFDVKDISAVVSAADKALAEAALGSSAAKGYAMGQYLDLSLYKVVGDSRNAITQTNGKIRVTINVPDSLKNTDGGKTRTFAVIRVHDGKAEVLTDLDNDKNTITIETDRFSTYAIVYKDTAGGVKDDEPKTGDAAPIERCATLAMISGFGYLLLYFTDRRRGMTEEIKKELVSRLIRWGKQGGKSRKYLALAAIFVLLVYYHSIGKKTCVEWKAVYGE